MSVTMGRLETLVVNSPFRRPFARREVRRYKGLTGLGDGARLLELGCGAGLTTREIAREFRPARLAASDLDPAQVARARRNVAGLPAVEVRQADATALPYGDGEFDAVIAIGVLHHIPRWRQALAEVARVLRPGGHYCFAEPTKGRLTRGMYRLFPHPPEAMFARRELLSAMAAAGLRAGAPGRSVLWDVFGVAQKG